MIPAYVTPQERTRQLLEQLAGRVTSKGNES